MAYIKTCANITQQHDEKERKTKRSIVATVCEEVSMSDFETNFSRSIFAELLQFCKEGYPKLKCRTVAQNYRKSWGDEFINIKNFIFLFTTSSCVVRVLCARAKSEKGAQMCSNAEHLLMVPSVAQKRFLDRGGGRK